MIPFNFKFDIDVNNWAPMYPGMIKNLRNLRSIHSFSGDPIDVYIIDTSSNLNLN